MKELLCIIILIIFTSINNNENENQTDYKENVNISYVSKDYSNNTNNTNSTYDTTNGTNLTLIDKLTNYTLLNNSHNSTKENNTHDELIVKNLKEDDEEDESDNDNDTDSDNIEEESVDAIDKLLNASQNYNTSITTNFNNENKTLNINIINNTINEKLIENISNNTYNSTEIRKDKDLNKESKLTLNQELNKDLSYKNTEDIINEIKNKLTETKDGISKLNQEITSTSETVSADSTSEQYNTKVLMKINTIKEIRDSYICNKESLIIITTDYEILRSDNKGKDWEKMKLSSSSTPIKFKSSKIEPNKVVIFTSNDDTHITNDCGKTIIKIPFHILDYQFHPYVNEWALAIIKKNKSQTLIVTLDNSQSFKEIISNVVQVGWGSQSSEDKVPSQRILLTYYPKQSLLNKNNSKNWFLEWTYKIDFVYSDDFFETTIAAVQKGNKFIMTTNYLFVAVLLDEDTQEVGLVVSNSKEERYLFNEVLINIKSISVKSFIFLETDGNSVFINVNQFSPSSNFGNIYSSGGFGERYGLSLEYNIRNKEDQCDFHGIDGIEGIFFANTIDKQYIEMNINDINLNMITVYDTLSIDDNNYKMFSNQDWLYNTLISHIETKITFNKGGHWSRIVSPRKTYDGKKVNCNSDNENPEVSLNINIPNKECYLNLHGKSSQYPIITSIKSAIGIIIGNGNIGKYLSYKEEDINTYLSRDAGLTWYEILPGSHIYEIGDSGSIIVFVKYNHQVDYFYYTLDQGLTMIKLSFPDQISIQVTSIITFNNHKSKEFLFIGKSILSENLTINIDFNSLKIRKCNDNSNLFTSQTDFEQWTPSNGLNIFNSCLMGKKTEYIRKKFNSICSLGEEYEVKANTDLCSCKAEDYECDIGFYRNGVYCQKENIDAKFEYDIFAPPSDCNDKYLVSKGYRKIAGNMCKEDGESEFVPMVMYCPNNIFSNSSTFLFGFITSIIVILFVLAFSKNALRLLKYICGVPNKYQNQFSYGLKMKDNEYMRLKEEENVLLIDKTKK